MWGDGANDAGTIPSQFASLTGIFSENFAERGYTAHQSLIQLMQLLQKGHRPALVIFYDGVNEVLHKCRAELTADSHERERQFEMVLQSSLDADSFSHYAAPLFKFARNMRREFQRAINTEQYDCHKNPAKRQAIAENLIRDWEFAKDLAERHGAKFVAILQPVSPLSNTRLEHVGIPPLVERGYKEVYPLIREKIASPDNSTISCRCSIATSTSTSTSATSLRTATGMSRRRSPRSLRRSGSRADAP